VDFFAAQDLRRKKTKWLVLAYAAAVLSIIVGIYAVIAIALPIGLKSNIDSWTVFFNPSLFAVVAVVNLVLIGGASLFKIIELRAGGAHIAAQLGGTLVQPATTDRLERRLLNVVEEMALAAGVSVPPVYVMNGEPGINAFAAGYTPADAVIGVNRGTLEQLNRDELQGVIAHEFSHVLNGDMRLNIQLIGWLCGIQLLATIGYFAMRAFGTGRRSRRSGKNDAAGLIFVVALALLIFGWIGQFFARMIKASISRQREFLADASAVQFTRYPDGIGGALKVIGASATGSRIESKEAEELSHMFFASSLSSGMSRLFSTHPPLVPRIQKLDVKFEGDFKGYFRVRQEKAKARSAARQKARAKAKERREKLSRLNPVGKMFPDEIASRFPVDPAILVGAIGMPELSDVDRSKVVIGQIPTAVTDAARHAFSSRCVAFAMLASDSPELRGKQLDLLMARENEATLATTKEILEPVETLPMVFRLPLMEMIQGSLANLSPKQYQHFRKSVDGLVRLDNKTSLFEFVVRHHLLMHLDRRFEVRRPPRIQFTKASQLPSEFELMLSAFASASVSGSVLEDTKADEHSVLQAYRLAMQVAGFGSAADSVAELRSWEVEQLEQCMLRLHRASPELKKQFLHAAATLITFDHEITVVEAEFFRAVGESLDCPVPLLAVGRLKK
jgi:Zn-dependent protease with chaperone function